MFCIKCGAENSDHAVYCLKCGNRFDEDVEQATKVSVRNRDEQTGDRDDEKQIFSIRPTLLFVKIGYGLAIIGAFLLVALFAFFGQATGYVMPWWISIFLGLSLLLFPAYFHLKQKMVRYTLTDSKVCIDEGLISKTTRNVPLRIIQDVTVSANFFQRMLGFGNLEIENANESDGKVILRNINSPKTAAEDMLKQMRRLDK